ncbi:hypothetical protein WJX84_004328 [Apatococcus fuscideae]|uniref:Uncharacterized protein n=1 Tax=Apatococcus fuscideae TaxID=2026836 RepID=A0AAW1SFA3_9CHLO
MTWLVPAGTQGGISSTLATVSPAFRLIDQFHSSVILQPSLAEAALQLVRRSILSGALPADEPEQQPGSASPHIGKKRQHAESMAGMESAGSHASPSGGLETSAASRPPWQHSQRQRGAQQPGLVRTAEQMKRLQEHKRHLEDMNAELKTLHVADMMQTAQEQKLAGLADRLLRLRATGASPRQRESLIVRTMTEINEIRRTTPHISQKKIFSPSIYVEELSQSQGFSMEAAMNSVLSGSYGATINISMGPLAGRYAVSEALTAPIQQYVDTQRQYLAGVVTWVDQAQGNSETSAGRQATRIMTEVIALSMCTMHARKRRLTWFQHLNLQTLRSGKLDLSRWLRVAKLAGLTDKQRKELVQLRKEYISCTQQTLGVRTQLWRNLRDSLASSQQALLSGGGSACRTSLNELEAVDALKLNMEMYLNTYAHMLRVWTMVCLTPFQIGVICAEAIPLTGKFTQDCPGLYLLEALAVEAGQPTTRELLSSVGNAPVLQVFAPRAYQADNSWQSMKDAAAVDPRMN